MRSEKINITIFLSVTTGLILLLAVIVILVIYLYQQKQLLYIHSFGELKLKHEKKLVVTQLEVQENMFRHISQEIHDNIGLTLSLAKLQLNSLDIEQKDKASQQIKSSIELLGESIVHLKNISRSLNADIINSYGLIKALENEINRIRDSGAFVIAFNIEGDPIYMDSQKELIIFRIVQEAFNNILKHSKATSTSLTLQYNNDQLIVTVADNGIGFEMLQYSQLSGKGKAGIRNMESRSRMIRAEMIIDSKMGQGTILQFTIPT